jgi:hypothetical protein
LQAIKANKIRFDLTGDGRPCDGELTFDDGVLTAAIDGSEVFRRGVDDAAELKQFTDIGCGRLELVLKAPDGKAGEAAALPDEENVRVCRFTMSMVNQAAELCKLVNYYIETGHTGQIAHTEKTAVKNAGGR